MAGYTAVPNATFSTATGTLPLSQLDANFAYLTAGNYNATGPAWATYSTLYNNARFTINSFPIAAQFGSNIAAITEALVGGIEIPSTAAGGNHCTGVSGYARSASTSQGAVGIFGCGACNANGVSAFGGNVVVTNSPTQASGTQTGKDSSTLYGIEIDVNFNKLPGGATPTAYVRGLFITGGAEVVPSAANAIHIGYFGTTATLAWTSGLYYDDGSVTIGINLGATSTGATVGAQSIRFRTRSASVDQTTDLAANSAGAITVTQANGGGIGARIILNNSGNAGGDQTSLLFQSGGTNRSEIRSTVEGAPFGGGLGFFVGSGSLTEALHIDQSSNVYQVAAGIATTATDGFLYIESCAGAPTGVPTAFSNRVPLVYDRTNNRIYAYNGAWRSVVVA